MKNNKYVAIIDYEISNLHSVKSACEHVGIKAVITNDYKKILKGKFISNYWDGLYNVIDSLKLKVNWLQIFIPHSRTNNSKEANI